MDTRAERATGVPMPTWREREAADER
jgi:hypothetical protein